MLKTFEVSVRRLLVTTQLTDDAADLADLVSVVGSVLPVIVMLMATQALLQMNVCSSSWGIYRIGGKEENSVLSISEITVHRHRSLTQTFKFEDVL